MRHARPDYDRFQDPAGKIPINEPVFLIRGQDVFGPAVLRFYANMAKSNNADPRIVDLVMAHASAMEAWYQKKLPDLPSNMGEEIKRLNELMPEHVLIAEPYTGGPLTEGQLPEGFKHLEEHPFDPQTGEPIEPIDITKPGFNMNDLRKR